MWIKFRSLTTEVLKFQIHMGKVFTRADSL